MLLLLYLLFWSQLFIAVVFVVVQSDCAALRADVKVVKLLSSDEIKAVIEPLAELSDDDRQTAAAMVRDTTNVGREQFNQRPRIEDVR